MLQMCSLRHKKQANYFNEPEQDSVKPLLSFFFFPPIDSNIRLFSKKLHNFDQHFNEKV